MKSDAWFAPTAVFVILATLALASPLVYNWDNLFYLGIAEMARGASVEDAQRSAYEQAREVLRPADYDVLVRNERDDDPLRSIVASDPEAFRQQLPFYSVKPVYPGLVMLARAAGINGVIASRWISALGFALLGALMCAWFARACRPLVAAVLALLVCNGAGLFNLALDPRPDGLLAVSVLAMSMVALKPGRFGPALAALMLLSMLIRPDAIIVCTLLCLGWAFLYREDARRALGTLAGCIAVYFAVTRLAGNYGWPLLMYHGLVKYLPYPETHPRVPTLQEWIHLFGAFSQPVTAAPFYTQIAIAVAALVACLRVEAARSRTVLLAVVMLATLPLHFIVHPTDNLRVRSAYYVVTLLLLLTALLRGPLPQVLASPRRATEGELASP